MLKGVPMRKFASSIFLLMFSLPLVAGPDVLQEAPGAENHRLGQYSGFEGREAELGQAAAELVKQLSDGQVDVSAREEEFGEYIAVALKTIQHSSKAYQHRLNDALVKAWLTQYQFAKDNQLIAQMVNAEARIQSPMLLRAKTMIERTGNRELALMAIFDQTTCHWQLVHSTQVSPSKRVYVAPFREVLAVTRGLGMFDLTEEEIHQKITIPRFHAYAAIMGVKFEVSEWNQQGIVSVSLVD